MAGSLTVCRGAFTPWGPSVRSLLIGVCLTGAVAAVEPGGPATSAVVLPPIERWSPDPLDPAGRVRDPLVTAAGGGRVRLGPFATEGPDWVVEVDPATWRARLLRGRERADLASQRFFRRLVLGPVPARAVGGQGDHHWWVLVRQGQVRLVADSPPLDWLADEFTFDLAYYAASLAGLPADQRAAWEAAWWQREAPLWESVAITTTHSATTSAGRLPGP